MLDGFKSQRTVVSSQQPTGDPSHSHHVPMSDGDGGSESRPPGAWCPPLTDEPGPTSTEATSSSLRLVMRAQQNTMLFNSRARDKQRTPSRPIPILLDCLVHASAHHRFPGIEAEAAPEARLKIPAGALHPPLTHGGSKPHPLETPRFAGMRMCTLLRLTSACLFQRTLVASALSNGRVGCKTCRNGTGTN